VRNSNILILYKTFVAFLALALAIVGFVTAWTFFHLQDSADSRAPGINLREI
jgi:hypothetical protein